MLELRLTLREPNCRMLDLISFIWLLNVSETPLSLLVLASSDRPLFNNRFGRSADLQQRR